MRPTLILRHHRERLAKCSLRGLESRADLQFITWPKNHAHGAPLRNVPRELIAGRIVLRMDSPSLTAADAAAAGAGLLIVDGTWRLASRMFVALDAWPGGLNLVPRSLPAGWLTAYPRRQTECPEPDAGLASVEALFAAHHILGLPTAGLLDHYVWRDQFEQVNTERIANA